MIENNKIELCGVIASTPELNHKNYGENFYGFRLSCSRKSTEKDMLPIIVSDRLVEIKDLQIGKKISVKGQVRTFNKHISDDKRKLLIMVFARDVREVEEESESAPEFNNNVKLSGYICKPPVYRVTPKGREIADVLIAVNRMYGKADYIPCITWGRNARYAGNIDVGTRIDVEGRLQSREYTKKLDDGTEEIRTAYEISVSRIEESEEK
jgi:single-stranded DNA-binding protein|nr:MAG TPA: Single strand binding protein [Bacteriophage sp.]